MPRTKLALPDNFSYTTELPLRITDINYGGHMGNDAVLAIVHEARLRFLGTMGFSELDAAGAGLIMTDATVVYKGQGGYGMNLEIKIAVDDVQMSGFDLYYLITDKESGKEISRVKTGMAFFSYERQRPVKTPALFKEKLTAVGAI